MLENCNSYIIPLYCRHTAQDHMPFSGTAIRNHKRSLCYSWTYVTSWTSSCGCFQTDNTLNVYGRATLSNLSGIIEVFNPQSINQETGTCCDSTVANLANIIIKLYWPIGWGNLRQNFCHIQAFKAIHCSWGVEVFSCRCANMSVICLPAMMKLSIDAINMAMNDMVHLVVNESFHSIWWRCCKFSLHSSICLICLRLP